MRTFSIVGALLLAAALSGRAQGPAPAASERLIYHDIRTDAQGHILPWFDDEPGKSYDHVIDLVWKFWEGMRADPNGLPYYLNHQVWRPDFNDARGLGGDQLQMAMSSWQLLYMYSGNERVKQNLVFLADHYLARGLSPADSAWPNIPFPYNTLIYSGHYDGDMVLGAGYTQPDKAGSFGWELIKLFKMYNTDRYPHATDRRYLAAATAIADTLAAKVQPGDHDRSPLPFKVNAFTGEVGRLLAQDRSGTVQGVSEYTTNWSGTMELFLELIRIGHGDTAAYKRAFDTMLAWMKAEPMRTNKWGPFFEDISGWSDTQINAMTWARFIMDHRELFPDWRNDVQRIIDWVYKTVGNDSWSRYGVTVVNEQTVYQNPGNSHTSRQAADELLFASLTGDLSRKAHAIRQLNWATYMVDHDGKNRYPRDENWLTDGYGDYVRHFLRAMAAAPELAPSGQNHILSSTTIVQEASYQGAENQFGRIGRTNVPATVMVAYATYGTEGTEVLRLKSKPSRVLIENQAVSENTPGPIGSFTWRPLDTGGVLTVQRTAGRRVMIHE